MRDGPIRRALKAVALGVFVVNLRTTRAIMRLRGVKPYRLGGTCGKCAACCEAPGIQVDKMTWFLPTARGLFLAWHRRVNGFELIERDVANRMFVFRCTHWDPETRRCDSYDSRPGMCRDYPRALLWQANPSMLPGCGYCPIAPNADKMMEALRREGLDEERLKRVKEKLHLGE